MRVAKERLRMQLEQYMEHPFAKEHVEPIIVEEIYLDFICEILEKKKIPEVIGLKYGCAILLAHLALNIHDELDRRNMRQAEKQLMILIGAYYTSLYYELLCDVKDEAFIYRMAKGIASQSEARMQFVQESFEGVSSFLKQKAEIDWIIFAEALEEFQLDVSEYTQYKYHFLQLSVAKEFNGLHTGQFIRPFYPEVFENMYPEGIEDVMLKEAEQFLRTK